MLLWTNQDQEALDYVRARVVKDGLVYRAEITNGEMAAALGLKRSRMASRNFKRLETFGLITTKQRRDERGYWHPRVVEMTAEQYEFPIGVGFVAITS